MSQSRATEGSISPPRSSFTQSEPDEQELNKAKGATVPGWSSIRTVTPDSSVGDGERLSQKNPASPSSPRSTPKSITHESSRNLSIRSHSSNYGITYRPRTRTLEDPAERPYNVVSRNRQRIGSVHSTSLFPFETPENFEAGTAGNTFPRSPAPSPIRSSSSRHRLIKSSPRQTRKESHSYAQTTSLSPPIPTTDAKKIIQLMQTSSGIAKGIIDFRFQGTNDWKSGLCMVNQLSNSLVYSENNEDLRELISDLRGCRIHVSRPEDVVHLLITSESIGLEIRPTSESLDSWLSALLYWQSLHPLPQDKIGKSPPGEDRPAFDGKHHPSNPSISKDAAIIKVGKMMMLDTFSTDIEELEWPPKQLNTKQASRWRRISCILQENGELKFYADSNVVLLAVVQLSQLSRRAIQQLDFSVFDTDFCLGIYPHYTSTSTSISLIRPIYLYIEPRVLYEVWYVLFRAFTIPEIYGPLSFRESEDSSEEDQGEFTSIRDMFRVERSFFVRIIEAKIHPPRYTPLLDHAAVSRGPAPESEPLRGEYLCELLLDGEVRGRTRSVPDTSNPFWREEFEFHDMSSLLSHASIVVRKHNKARIVHSRKGHASHSSTGLNADGLLGLGTVFGKVEITLDDLRRNRDQEAWWPIVNNGGRIGELLLRVKLDESVILISHEYHTLSELLGRFPNGLTGQIAHVIPSEVKRLSELLLNIFQVSGQAGEWLMSLAEEEIDGIYRDTPLMKFQTRSRIGSNDSYDSSSDREQILRDISKTVSVEANLLFRGNTLLTRALDMHMKRLGKDYLEETLGERLRQIESSELDCEVDPSRVPSQHILHKNWRHLMDLTNSIWNSIASSVSRCPSELRRIFRHIRACADDRYGDFLRTVSYSSVYGFLFLRFICPAVLNPKLFGLMKEHPKPRAHRTLTLVAKSLQGLANMTTFGVKESWMEPMNQFLVSHRQEYKKFIDDICSVSPDRSSAAIPPSYATPIAILSRLPPMSREGFPSLPYLIDHARNFASLVTLWLEPPTTAGDSVQVEGELLEFHQLCQYLQRRRNECLQRAEDSDKAVQEFSFRWERLAGSFKGSVQGPSESTTSLSLPANVDGSRPGSTI